MINSERTPHVMLVDELKSVQTACNEGKLNTSCTEQLSAALAELDACSNAPYNPETFQKILAHIIQPLREAAIDGATNGNGDSVIAEDACKARTVIASVGQYTMDADAFLCELDTTIHKLKTAAQVFRRDGEGVASHLVKAGEKGLLL